MSEIHKSLTLLTPQGLINAIAHGAYKIKSRFRTASEPFSYLRAWIYHEPVKNQYKITDLEAIDLFEGLRASLNRFYTASLWAEAVLRSFGGGADGGPGSISLFRLLLTALAMLNQCPRGQEPMISIQFLWRFLFLLGYGPELETCSGCQASIGRDEASFLVGDAGGFYCKRCAGSRSGRLAGSQAVPYREDRILSGGLPGSAGGLTAPASVVTDRAGHVEVLSPGARRYLQQTAGQTLEWAVKVRLGQASVLSLKRALYRYLQDVLGSGLNTLKSGAAYL